MVVEHTERRDETVDRLSHCPATTSQQAVVAGSGSRQFDSSCAEDLETSQLSERARRLGFILNALQNLAENQVREAQSLARQFVIEPINFGIALPIQEVNPDRRVNDRHDSDPFRSVRAANLQIANPPNPTTQLADADLPASLYEQPQRFVDDTALGRPPTRAHRLPHQPIVDLDVRSHERLDV
jgi:hypothetical protein